MSRLFAIVVTVALIAAVVSAEGTPPPEIAALMAKMQSGATLTSAEQMKVRAWQQQQMFSAGGGAGAASGGAFGFMPPEIAAIIAKAQTGVPPTAEEQAKLKSWAAQIQSNKQNIVNDATQKRQTLEAAKPAVSTPRRAVVNPFLDGELVTDQTVVTTGKGDCHGHPVTLSTRMRTHLTFPVRLRTQVPGGPPSATGEPPASGPFSVFFEPRDGRFGQGNVAVDITGCDTPGSTQGMNNVPPPGELFVDPGRRIFVNVGSGIGTIDPLLDSVPWQRGGLSPALLARMPQLRGAIPRERVDEAKAATFSMKPEALRTAMAARKTATVTGTYEYIMRPDASTTLRSSTLVTIKIAPPPTGLQIAVLDSSSKASTDTWRKWLPRPWLIDANDARAFSLQPKDPAVAMHVGFSFVGGRRGQLHVTLDEVSHNKGLTTNYPVEATEAPKGLKFIPNQAAWRIDSTGQSADLKDAAETAAIDVVAVEPGAWGKLRVRSPDLELDGTFEPAGDKDYLQLPRDDDNDHVADQWEEETGAYTQTSGSLWDEDPLPANQRRNGDGYTLYEEYRGFIVRNSSDDGNHKYVRTRWNHKDLFVSDQDGMFQKYYEPSNAAQLDWHYVDIQTMKMDRDVNSRKHRWVNTNTPSDLKYADQYGIIVERDDQYPVGAEAQARNNANPLEPTVLHPLQNFNRVVVNPRAGARLFSTANFPRCSAEQRARMAEADIPTAVIHEVGHHIGIHHHLMENPDLRHPLIRDGKLVWFESEDEQMGGSTDCALRYGRTSTDAQFSGRTCFRPALLRYCDKSDKAYYHENFQHPYPSNNCFGQIDVKSDP